MLKSYFLKIRNKITIVIRNILLKYLQFKFRKSKRYTIGYILNIIPMDQIVRKAGKSKKRKGKYIVFDGLKIRCYSRKFYFFQKQYQKNHTIYCPICGLKADYFRVTPTGSFNERLQPHYTFNLFGIRNNKQVLFDIDHIKPVAKGGKNHKNNLRILCHECNNEKADNI